MAVAPHHTSSAGSCAARVLVVAPKTDDRRQLEDLLAREHMEAATTDSAAPAIDALLSRSFDIVLSNIALRGPWEGLDLARWIVGHQPSTGILLLSDRFPWIPANSPIAMVPVLVRPLVAEILIGKVRSAIASGPRQPEANRSSSS